MLSESFEDVININLPEIQIETESQNWKQYNPRKKINRWGRSLTSLDGHNTGIPDLDSLYEYNKLNGTNYRESDFRTLTDEGKKFEFLTESFDLGRSHLIKLDAGGYFPYHRDLGPEVFRLIYCVSGCEPTNLVWIIDDKVVKLQNRRWYYVNTKKVHATFAFNTCVFAVFNVINNEKGFTNIKKVFEIK